MTDRAPNKAKFDSQNCGPRLVRRRRQKGVQQRGPTLCHRKDSLAPTPRCPPSLPKTSDTMTSLGFPAH